MAVDSGWIVAGSSLATILATGLFSIWSKRIDAKQKVNEHKLTIRASYVNKKIDAGIDFVSKTTIRINNHYLITVFCKYLIENRVFNKEYYDAIVASRNKQRETNLSNSFSPHSFFDIVNLNEEANKLILEYNSHQIILSDYLKSEGDNEYTSDIDTIVRKSLEINENIIKVYQIMNISVRTELAKYDIL
ncbi:hypothetical protein ACVWYF_003296 [Hymenobacter sp. UYAg731]